MTEEALPCGPEVDYEANVSPPDQQVCTDKGTAGAAQRLRIRVPNVFTQMSLGQALQDEDSQGYAYPGFGVETDGHVFIDAHGGVASSAIKIQGNGPVMLQTDQSNMSTSAAGNNLMHAGNVAMIAGDTDVFISGGLPHGGSTNYASDGTNPQAPDWLAQVSSTVNSIGETWKNIDSAAAYTELALAALQTTIDARKGDLDKAGVIRTAVNSVFSAWGGNCFGIGDAIDSTGIPGSGGNTVVYGQGGLIMGTARSAGLFSAIGTSLCSTVAVGALAPWIGLTSVDSLEVGSLLGPVSLSAKGALDIISKNDGVEIASRTNETQVLGKTVRVGAKPAEKSSQEETVELHLYGQSVTVETDQFQVQGFTNFKVDEGANINLGAKETMNLQAAGDLVVGGDKVEISAGKELSVQTGGKFGMNLKKSKFWVGVNTKTPKYPYKDLKKRKFKKKYGMSKTEAKAKWAKKVEQMKAGDVGIEIKKSSVRIIAKGYELKLTKSKLQAAGNALTVKK